MHSNGTKPSPYKSVYLAWRLPHCRNVLSQRNNLIKLVHNGETKKRAHDSQIVRDNETLKLSHDGPNKDKQQSPDTRAKAIQQLNP